MRCCRSWAPQKGGLCSAQLPLVEGTLPLNCGRELNTPGWEWWSFRIADGGWFDESFVEEARATRDPVLWRQEFEASIEPRLGAVYPDFGKANIGQVEFNPQEQLMFGVDFNRTPFCGCILQVQGDTLAVLKKYVLIDANIEEMAAAVRKDFPMMENLRVLIRRHDASTPHQGWVSATTQSSSVVASR